IPCLQHGDRAIGANGNADSIVRDGNLRLQRKPVGIHDTPLAIELERTGAAIGYFPIWAPNLEEPGAIDGDIELILRLLEVAFQEQALHCRRAHTEPELNASRNFSLVRGRCPRLTQGLV